MQSAFVTQDQCLWETGRRDVRRDELAQGTFSSPPGSWHDRVEEVEAWMSMTLPFCSLKQGVMDDKTDTIPSCGSWQHPWNPMFIWHFVTHLTNKCGTSFSFCILVWHGTNRHVLLQLQMVSTFFFFMLTSTAGTCLKLLS